MPFVVVGFCVVGSEGVEAVANPMAAQTRLRGQRNSVPANHLTTTPTEQGKNGDYSC